MMRITALLVLLLCFPTNLLADQSFFSKRLKCSYQFGQYLETDSHEAGPNSKPLVWEFAQLLGKKPMYYAGGDFGRILVHRHSFGDGISIFLDQANGGHMFTIWPSGNSFWSKHNNILGIIVSQQFRGTCAHMSK